MRDRSVMQQCKVLDTDVFGIVIATDFLQKNPRGKNVVPPASLCCSLRLSVGASSAYFGNCQDAKSPGCATQHGQTIVPKATSWPNTSLKMDWRPCRYAWMTSMLNRSRVQQQHVMQLFPSKHWNNAFRFFSKAMGLAYAYPPFSVLANVLTKIAYVGARVVLCTPNWGRSGEHTYWHQLLDRMTVGRVQLPGGPIYVPEDSEPTLQAREWTSFLSIIDESLNLVPLWDLDQVLLKEVIAKNRLSDPFGSQKTIP